MQKTTEEIYSYDIACIEQGKVNNNAIKQWTNLNEIVLKLYYRNGLGQLGQNFCRSYDFMG